MPLPTHVSVAISLGTGADFAITRGGDLIAIQEYAPALYCRVQLGKLSLKCIEELQSYLERLKCHAVDV